MPASLGIKRRPDPRTAVSVTRDPGKLFSLLVVFSSPVPRHISENQRIPFIGQVVFSLVRFLTGHAPHHVPQEHGGVEIERGYRV